jgi:ribosomal protein L32
MEKKPNCKLSGVDGNVFMIVGTVSKTLKRAGMAAKAEEFCAKAKACGSYDEALQLCMDYVEVS